MSKLRPKRREDWLTFTEQEEADLREELRFLGPVDASWKETGNLGLGTGPCQVTIPEASVCTYAFSELFLSLGLSLH